MVPNLAYVQELFAYNDWANDRVLDAVAKIESELLKRDLGNSFPSLHDTLAHIAAAEWIWLERWLGHSPERLPSGPDFSGLDAVVEELRTVRADRNQWLGDLAEDALAQNVSYRNLRGVIYVYPLWQQMTHVLNHSTYHRGQVTTMLRQLGQKAVSTDFLVFYDERNGQAATAGQR